MLLQNIDSSVPDIDSLKNTMLKTWESLGQNSVSIPLFLHGEQCVSFYSKSIGRSLMVDGYVGKGKSWNATPIFSWWELWKGHFGNCDIFFFLVCCFLSFFSFNNELQLHVEKHRRKKKERKKTFSMWRSDSKYLPGCVSLEKPS